MWDWLQIISNWSANLPVGTASFLGSFAGAALGLIAVVIGLLINARINRKHDDRVRREDARATAIALRSELSAIDRSLRANAEHVATKMPAPGETYCVSDMSQALRVMPNVLPKMSLFDAATTQYVLDAYAALDQRCEAMRMIGGQPAQRAILVPATSANEIADIDRNTSEFIQIAIEKLDTVIL